MNKPIDTTMMTLIDSLADPREGLRQFAMRRIVNMGERVVPQLIFALKDPRDTIQQNVALALITLGPVSVPFLLDAMKSDERRIRWGATWVLSAMGDEARRALPSVKWKIPEESTPRSAVPQSGVWSDSWLTKARKRLEETRDGMMGFAATEPPPEPVGG